MTEPTPTPTDPSVRPTSLLWLAVVAVAAALAGVVTYTVIDAIWGTPPSPGPASIWIFVLGAITTLVAIMARRQIHRERRRVDPRLATRWLALGKTSEWAGAALVGVFVAWALRSIPHADTQAGGPRLWWSVLAAVSALYWTVAGVSLERACRVPRDGDGPRGPGGEPPDPDAPTS